MDETKNVAKPTRQEQIASLKAHIESLSAALPYADGTPYYEDVRRIAELSAELKALEAAL